MGRGPVVRSRKDESEQTKGRGKSGKGWNKTMTIFMPELDTIESQRIEDNSLDVFFS